MLRRGLHRLSSSFSFPSLTPFHPAASIFPFTPPIFSHSCDLCFPPKPWINPLFLKTQALKLKPHITCAHILACLHKPPADAILRCDLITIANRIHVCIKPTSLHFRRCDIAMRSDRYQKSHPCMYKVTPLDFRRCDIVMRSDHNRINPRASLPPDSRWIYPPKIQRPTIVCSRFLLLCHIYCPSARSNG